MLYRKNEQKIKNFIEKDLYKSMLLIGVRQCGKTTLLNKMFEKYNNFIYCNLELESEISNLFEDTLKPLELIRGIEIIKDKKLNKDKLIILVLDEIQVSHNAITSLKYFTESDLNIKVIGSGSLLGVEIQKGGFSFPVGKVDILNMYPLDFEEYLINVYDEDYVTHILEHYNNNNKKISEPIHNKYLKIFDEFLEVGAMPQAVQNFIDKQQEYKKIHENLNTSYQNDILKYVETNDRLKIRKILDNLGNQLLKDNQKFKFSTLKVGGRFKEFENSFLWLSYSEIVYSCYIIDNNKVTSPIKSLIKDNSFKLFYCDTTLLLEKMKYNIHDIAKFEKIYLGVVIENYVATELYKKYGELYNYNNNSIEVDFLIQKGNSVIPIEVKAGNNTQSKSLKSYMIKNNPDYAIRISRKNFGYENNIKSIPVYATFLI